MQFTLLICPVYLHPPVTWKLASEELWFGDFRPSPAGYIPCSLTSAKEHAKSRAAPGHVGLRRFFLHATSASSELLNSACGLLTHPPLSPPRTRKPLKSGYEKGSNFRICPPKWTKSRMRSNLLHFRIWHSQGAGIESGDEDRRPSNRFADIRQQGSSVLRTARWASQDLVLRAILGK